MVAGFDGIEFYNVDEVEGLAEAAFYGVLATPSILVIGEDGEQIASWRGDVPSKEDLRVCMRV